MDNNQLDITEKCAALLYENRFSRNFLYEFMQEAFKNHEWMEIFGLVSENDYRIRFPLPVSDIDSAFKGFLENICLLKSRENGGTWKPIDSMFIEDGKKNKHKVTRILTPSLWKNLIKQTHGYNVFVKSGKMFHCVECTFEKPDKLDKFVKDFNIWYGERIKSGIDLILSCNPHDMMTASWNTSWTSCYKPKGEWFNGTLSNTLSPNTLIAYIEERNRPDYKVGRAWIYVNETIIIVGRPYGIISPAHSLNIRNYLYSKFGGEWMHKPGTHMGDGVLLMEGPGYLDREFGDITVSKGITTKPIKVIKSICLYCGSRFKDCGYMGVCAGCYKKVPHSQFAE
jgi:hypothetical protein